MKRPTFAELLARDPRLAEKITKVPPDLRTSILEQETQPKNRSGRDGRVGKVIASES